MVLDGHKFSSGGITNPRWYNEQDKAQARPGLLVLGKWWEVVFGSEMDKTNEYHHVVLFTAAMCVYSPCHIPNQTPMGWLPVITLYLCHLSSGVLTPFNGARQSSI